MIMLSRTPLFNDAVWTYLLASMRDESAFRERVRDACRRVLELKLERLRGEGSVPFIPDLKKVASELPHPEGSAFFLDLAARSVTVVSGEHLFPLEDAGRVLLAGNFAEFFSAGKKAFPGAASYWYSPSRGAAELAGYVRNADTVIFCLSDRGGLGILREIRRFVETGGKKLIVFSILNPVYLEEVSWADGAVAVYSSAPESFTAGFSVIAGRIPGGGRLPFSLTEAAP